MTKTIEETIEETIAELEPVAWMMPHHIAEYQSGDLSGIAWANHSKNDAYTAPLFTIGHLRQLLTAERQRAELMEAERDAARNDEWLAAISAVQYMRANWHQDCRSEIARSALHDATDSIIDALRDAGPTEYLDMKWKGAEHALAMEKRAIAAEARLKEAEAALVSPYCGLIVLKTMLRKVGLDGGVEVTEKAIADLVALHPALPSLSALRAAPSVGPGYIEQPDFIYFECDECGFDSVQKADFTGSYWCPMCASDNHDTRMSSRVCRSTDKPEGRDARAFLTNGETDANHG